MHVSRHFICRQRLILTHLRNATQMSLCPVTHELQTICRLNAFCILRFLYNREVKNTFDGILKDKLLIKKLIIF